MTFLRWVLLIPGASAGGAIGFATGIHFSAINFFLYSLYSALQGNPAALIGGFLRIAIAPDRTVIVAICYIMVF